MSIETNSPVVTFYVPGMSCEHCRIAITGEVGQLAGVESVAVDLDSKQVEVSGRDLDTGAIVDAIDEAGYDAVVS